jgi:hypothetical protein
MYKEQLGPAEEESYEDSAVGETTAPPAGGELDPAAQDLMIDMIQKRAVARHENNEEYQKSDIPIRDMPPGAGVGGGSKAGY